MNITIPKNIEDYLKGKFSVSDLTAIVNNVVSDWAKNEVRLSVNSKPIDIILSDEIVLKEAKIQAKQDALTPKLGSIKLKNKPKSGIIKSNKK